MISPLLSNIYLDPLDHHMAAAGFQMMRYADDFVVLCRSRQEAEAALEVIRQWVAEAGLTLHPEKTRIADAPKGKLPCPETSCNCYWPRRVFPSPRSRRRPPPRPLRRRWSPTTRTMATAASGSRWAK